MCWEVCAYGFVCMRVSVHVCVYVIVRLRVGVLGRASPSYHGTCPLACYYPLALLLVCKSPAAAAQQVAALSHTVCRYNTVAVLSHTVRRYNAVRRYNTVCRYNKEYQETKKEKKKKKKSASPTLCAGTTRSTRRPRTTSWGTMQLHR